jgi:hypothetical protein
MAYPLQAGGVIYVPGSSMSTTSSLMLAIRASDGIKLWSRQAHAAGFADCGTAETVFGAALRMVLVLS